MARFRPVCHAISYEGSSTWLPTLERKGNEMRNTWRTRLLAVTTAIALAVLMMATGATTPAAAAAEDEPGLMPGGPPPIIDPLVSISPSDWRTGTPYDPQS